MPITTKRGLEFNSELPNELAQAEIFCELTSKHKEDLEEQREVALQLFLYYLEKNNYEKALKFAIQATGSKPDDKFDFDYTDFFSWYHIYRIFVASLNRLMTFFKAAFLPAWYALTGLAYGIQVLIAHVRGDKKNEFYWSAWGLLNGFGCLVLFGVLVGSGVGFPIALLGVSIYCFLFDVKWDIYNYFTERGNHEKLLVTLDKNKSQQRLKDSLNQKIKTMKGDRIENGIVDTTIMIGGILFCLSAFLPPVFAPLGASIILGAFTYLAAKKIYNSWKEDSPGFLNHYVRIPLINFSKNPMFYLKKPWVYLSSKLKASKSQDSNVEFNTLTPQNPTLNSPENDNARTSLPTYKMIPPAIEQKLDDPKTIVEAISPLPIEEQKTAKNVLTSETHQSWNKTLETYIKGYLDENRPLKQTIKICRNHLQSTLRKEKKEDNQENANELNKNIQFLQTMESQCNGLKSNDLGLVSGIFKNDFIQEESLRSDETRTKLQLLNLLGIQSFDEYKKQYSRWEKYYDNTKRINSPFFDHPLTPTGSCSFEMRTQMEQPKKKTVKAV